MNQVVNKDSKIYRTPVIFCGCTFVSGLVNTFGKQEYPTKYEVYTAETV
jgi:hypothetical protein